MGWPHLQEANEAHLGAPEPPAAARLRGLAVFVSANAVVHSMSQRPIGQPWPDSLWAAATGPGTTAALLDAGVPAARILAPDDGQARYDSEALWQQRLQGLHWAGVPVWVLRGETGRNWLTDRLSAAGARVQTIVAYRRGPPIWTQVHHGLLRQAWAQPGRWGWHFSASEGLLHLQRAASDAFGPHASESWARARAAAPHPRIAQVARDLGFLRVQAVGASARDVADWWRGDSLA